MLEQPAQFVSCRQPMLWATHLTHYVDIARATYWKLKIFWQKNVVEVKFCQRGGKCNRWIQWKLNLLKLQKLQECQRLQ